MSKPTGEDYAWLVLIIPFFAAFSGLALFIPAALLALGMIFGMNLHTGIRREPKSRAARKAAKRAKNKDDMRHYTFGRMALYALALVVICFLFSLSGNLDIGFSLLFFWITSLFAFIGLVVDANKRDALISLGIGLVMIVFVTSGH